MSEPIIDVLHRLQGLLKAQCPEGIGYSLWVLQGEPEQSDVATMLYISSADRSDVCTMLEEKMLADLTRRHVSSSESDDSKRGVADDESFVSRAHREVLVPTIERMRRIVKLNFPTPPAYDHVLILFDFGAGGHLVYDTSLPRAVLGKRLAYWVLNQRARMREAKLGR